MLDSNIFEKYERKVRSKRPSFTHHHHVARRGGDGGHDYCLQLHNRDTNY